MESLASADNLALRRFARPPADNDVERADYSPELLANPWIGIVNSITFYGDDFLRLLSHLSPKLDCVNEHSVVTTDTRSFQGLS
jgi:hypothetical protein